MRVELAGEAWNLGGVKVRGDGWVSGHRQQNMRERGSSRAELAGGRWKGGSRFRVGEVDNGVTRGG